ncbi:hypothetical protein CDD83_2091 [Cordyceps sp. RAO-2017]|nr:hypothetical protein CDD83_2091 [Cordyceps sp. RAO-2017]
MAVAKQIDTYASIDYSSRARAIKRPGPAPSPAGPPPIRCRLETGRLPAACESEQKRRRKKKGRKHPVRRGRQEQGKQDLRSPSLLRQPFRRDTNEHDSAAAGREKETPLVAISLCHPPPSQHRHAAPVGGASSSPDADQARPSVAANSVSACAPYSGNVLLTGPGGGRPSLPRASYCRNGCGRRYVRRRRVEVRGRVELGEKGARRTRGQRRDTDLASSTTRSLPQPALCSELPRHELPAYVAPLLAASPLSRLRLRHAAQLGPVIGRPAWLLSSLPWAVVARSSLAAVGAEAVRVCMRRGFLIRGLASRPTIILDCPLPTQSVAIDPKRDADGQSSTSDRLFSLLANTTTVASAAAASPPTASSASDRATADSSLPRFPIALGPSPAPLSLSFPHSSSPPPGLSTAVHRPEPTSSRLPAKDRKPALHRASPSPASRSPPFPWATESHRPGAGGCRSRSLAARSPQTRHVVGR